MNNRTWKKTALYLVLIIAVALEFIHCIALNNEYVLQPVEGVLDLSEHRESDEVIKLNGEWEFYWGRLLSHSDFQVNALPPGKMTVQVPDTWNSYQINGRQLDGEGYATYRLRVVGADKQERFSLRINPLSTAYSLHINDLEIASNGVVGKSSATSLPGYKPLIVEFSPPSESFDIILHISNYSYARGGFWYSIDMGSPESVKLLNEAIIYKDAILMGSLLIMALYYASFYFVLKRDKSSKYLMWLSIIFMIRTSLYGDILIIKLFPHIPFDMLIFITYATLYWIPVIMYLVVDSIFYNVLSEQIKKGFITFAIVMTTLTAMLPIKIYTGLILPVEVLGIGMIFCSIYIIFKAYLRREKGSGQTLLAVSAILLSGIHDVMYQANVIDNSIGEISAIGIFLFMFNFAFLLAHRVSDAYEQSRHLTLKLAAALETEKHMSLQLREYDRYKDDFLTRTSHELKTPLHAIINITRTVLEHGGIDENHRSRENLEFVVAVAQKLSGLINDIIDVHSIKNNKLHLDLKTIDLNGPVNNVCLVVQKLYGNKPVIIKNEIPGGVFHVIADENRLRQILFNLIGNAMKYTDSGVITLQAKTAGNEIHLFVEDTGRGIDPGQRDGIFDGYPSGLQDKAEEIPSTGLGLPIAKSLAELMGGRLWLEESALGMGSTFCVMLPASATEKGKQLALVIAGVPCDEEAVVTDPGEIDHDAVTILVVDDEISNIKVIQNLLADEKYRLIIANNGDQAIECVCNNENITLILLDDMMPRKSGIEVCREIREKYTLFELPILLLTVKNSPEEVATGLMAGANDYLAKPFDALELKARARNLIELKQSVRNSIDLEMAFLHSQIKPHFVYNALSVIMSLCYTDGKRAGGLLAEFSNYLRYSFDFNPQKPNVSLDKELDIVRSFVAIQKARFGERLSIKYLIDDGIGNASMPALLIQPLVENAIKHGIMKRVLGGEIVVKVMVQDQMLNISVADDGVGIPDEQLAALNKQDNSICGVGIRNIQRRLKTSYGEKLVIDSRVGEGTLVRFRLPLRQQARQAE